MEGSTFSFTMKMPPVADTKSNKDRQDSQQDFESFEMAGADQNSSKYDDEPSDDY